MFELIESCPDQRPGFGWTGKLVSFTIHAFVVSAAIAATKSVVDQPSRGIEIDTLISWQTPPDVPPHTVHTGVPIPGPTPMPFVPPTTVPIEIPPPGPLPTFVPGIGLVVSPGPLHGLEPSELVVGSAPREVQMVDELPILLSHPPIVYPEAMRQAGVEGRVVVETVLDTLGRAAPALTRVTQSGTALFDREAVSVVLASRYRPARVAGHAVRVRIAVPVSFTISR